MTVAAKTPRVEYQENGVTKVFAVGFRFDATSLRARRYFADGSVAELVRGVDFTQSGGETDDGGVLSVTAPAATGTKLRIWRETEKAQTANYTATDDFPAETHEAALDRDMMIAQEQEVARSDLAARAILMPEGEGGLSLGKATDRRLRLLGFTDDGDPAALGAAAVVDILRAQLTAIAKGDPGGNVESVGLFAALEGKAIPAGTDRVRSAGYGAIGVGMAEYVADASLDAAYAAAHPLSCFTAEDGRFFRLDVSRGVLLTQLGAVIDDAVATAANDAAMVEALAISDVVIFPIGTVHFDDAIVVPSGKSLVGLDRKRSKISNVNADTGLFETPAIAGGSEFTSWHTDILFANFTIANAAVQEATAIALHNVRRLVVRDIDCTNYSLLSIKHGAQLNGIYDHTTGVSGDEGVGVDPAVTAGFSSAENADDLSCDIVLAGCLHDSGRYNGTLARLEFAQRVTITGNVCRGGKVSWWGGGGPVSEGGEPWMRRRVRNVAITGNYFDYVNGAVYGNNGDGITVTGNTAKNITDTCYDMEGCFNCTIVGNHVQDAGNFCLSIFYAAKNIVFSGNSCVQTLEARNVGFEDGEVGYSASRSPTSLSAGTASRVRMTIAGHRMMTGQKIWIPAASATGSLAAMGDICWSITKIDADNFELDGSEAYGAVVGSGAIASFYFRRGWTFFAANTAGFATGDDAHTVLVADNAFEYRTAEDLGILAADQDIRSFTLRSNYMRNVRIDLTGSSAKHIVDGNTLDFTNAAYAGDHLLRAMGTIKDNHLVILAAQPAGTAAIVGYEFASGGNWNRCQGNQISFGGTGSVETELAIYARQGSSHTADTHYLVKDNVLVDGTFADLSSNRGAARVRFEGNSRFRLNRISESWPDADGEQSEIGGIVHGTILFSNAPAASGYMGLIATNDGWATEQQWVSGADYAAGAVVYNGAEVYMTVTGGTAGASAPVHPSGTVSDGTVDWIWIAKKVVWKGVGQIAA
ncbi:right-handed parallel beta-helix repeat-containing protein [Croceicoccus mobilis]|uniref:Right handed beta helix domain-containing protein n=1 Tax=Croceicoccus mobilis TaxID=1703339 RepID=A0A916Z359_9SPHN|nr:hypothetical protein [Croceicoccus mobilis]GGD73838.1 hypothetical protein GCM10010990_24320 [Croceicoccus mobilis]